VPTASNGRNQRSTAKRPADFTGMRKQQLEAEHAAELKETAKSVGLAAENRAREISEMEVDYTGLQSPDIQEISPQPVAVKDPYTSIRVNYPIEDMTFGRDVYLPGDKEHPLGADATEPWVGGLKSYTFEEGISYRVPRALADYLDAKGYIWH
jgi:hypothetical protein